MGDTDGHINVNKTEADVHINVTKATEDAALPHFVGLLREWPGCPENPRRCPDVRTKKHRLWCTHCSLQEAIVEIERLRETVRVRDHDLEEANKAIMDAAHCPHCGDCVLCDGDHGEENDG